MLTRFLEQITGTPSAEEERRATSLIPIPGEALAAVGSTDSLVLSYPRSGNTWFCVQLAYAWEKTLEARGVKPIAGWQVADLHRVPPHPLLAQQTSPAHPRIFRSHNHLPGLAARTVYLVRRPEDALVSYYRLVAGESGSSPSGFAWERLPDWIAHVKLAIRLARKAPGTVLILRYEDMTADPGAVLDRAGRFLGLGFPAEAIQNALERSALGRMKQEEAARNRPKSKTRQGELFRSGVVGRGREELRPSTLREVLDRGLPWYDRISRLAASVT